MCLQIRVPAPYPWIELMSVRTDFLVQTCFETFCLLFASSCVLVWNVRIMTKWRASFKSVVQETKFDWLFFIESRTHQTPTGNPQRIRLVREKREKCLRENGLGALGRKTERDHRRLGPQFFLHYVLFFFFFFPTISAIPGDPLVKMIPSSARLEICSSQCLNLITATTFFSWGFKETILTCATSRFSS
jgi:hypothetical protein